jgi:ribosome biogenesis protein ERB1
LNFFVRFRKTVHDKSTGQDVVLSNADVDLIMKLQQGKLTGTSDPYEPFEDIFSHEVMKTSLSTRPPHKRSFVPSLLEKEKISKLVHAIKMGWIKPWKAQSDSTEEPEQQYYALWEKEKEEVGSHFEDWEVQGKRLYGQVLLLYFNFCIYIQ